MVSVKKDRVKKILLVLQEITVQPEGKVDRQFYEEGQILGKELVQRAETTQKEPLISQRAS